jgi:hypothetical protein
MASMKRFLSSIFGTKITKAQSRDTGMALVLVLLLCSAFIANDALLPTAIIALVVNMTFPQLYFPLAVLWFGFAHLLGTIMSRIILAIVFFGVVTPIALVRKLAGKDALQLGAFKAGSGSVLLARDHTYTVRDIEKPY